MMDSVEPDLKFAVIEFMRYRPYLWNIKDPFYKDNKKRETEFESFSRQIKMPVKEIKRVWHVLRTNFFRAHKIFIGRPPGCDRHEKLWKYYQSMTYILPPSDCQSHQANNSSDNSSVNYINIHGGAISNNYDHCDNSTGQELSSIGQQTRQTKQRSCSARNSNHTIESKTMRTTSIGNSTYNCNQTSPSGDIESQVQTSIATNLDEQYMLVDNQWGSSSEPFRSELKSLDCDAITSEPRAKKIKKSNNFVDTKDNSTGNSSAYKYSIPTMTMHENDSNHPQSAVDLLLGDLKDDDELYARALACSLRRFDPTTKEIVKLKFQEIIVKYMQQRQRS